MERERRYHYLILFLANATAMTTELVIARILTPILGSSNVVWTIVISIILFANSIGNYAGGRLSNNKGRKRLDMLMFHAMSIGTMAMLIMAGIDRVMIDNAGMSTAVSKAGVIILLALCLIHSVVTGIISPVINELELNEGQIGEKSGIIYTVITLGGLFGTLAGGLFLIPRFGCLTIIHMMALISAVCAFIPGIGIIRRHGKMKHIVVMSLIMTAAVESMFSIVAAAQNNGIDTATGGYRTVIDTKEGYVTITDVQINNEPARIMSISGGYSSAIYKDPQKRNELIFDYCKNYNIILDTAPQLNTFLMIGGAGYTWPRYLKANYPDKAIDVVEIDGRVTEIAKEYMYLDEFLNEHGKDSMGLYTDDGKLYLKNTDKKYDAILNDAFLGHSPARSLSTLETVQDIHDCLNEEGIYATNIIGNTEKSGISFLKSEVKTIKQVFYYTWLVPAGSKNTKGEQNYILFASDKDYGIKNAIEIRYTDNDVVFTDNYAPVEYFSSAGNISLLAGNES